MLNLILFVNRIEPLKINIEILNFYIFCFLFYFLLVGWTYTLNYQKRKKFFTFHYTILKLLCSFIIDEIPSTIQIIYEPIVATTTKTVSVKATNAQPIVNTGRKIAREIVSYQRFGRIQNNPSFKCHLCGFSCGVLESLLKHFNKIHPN